MAALIDTAADAEVELIDDELYLYCKYSTPIWKPEVMQRLQLALLLLHERFMRQAQSYSDDRVSMPTSTTRSTGVSLSGRRMTHSGGISAMTWLSTGIVTAVSGALLVFSLFVLPNV